MKAPDMIYVREFPDGLNQMWSSALATETSAIAQHEYIRKDVMNETIKVAEDHAYFAGQEKFREKLLEWAKEAHDSGPIKDSADKGDAWSIGYLCGMKDIIDKLNSL